MYLALEERRQHPRAPFDQELEVEVWGGPEYRGVATDISEGGMRLTGASLPPHSAVTIQLPLERNAGADSFRVVGRIVRSSGCDVAIAFRQLLPAHFLRLRDYVWRRSTRRRLAQISCLGDRRRR